MIDSYVSRIFKFSGAGNDFVVLDGRQGGMDPYRDPARIGQLCQEYHTDGLMILTLPQGAAQPVRADACNSAMADASNLPMADASQPAKASVPVMADSDWPGSFDFVMEFYNPDGSGGMMCGNGGRCIVAFANYLGINPADGQTYHFLAPDGEHTAEILSKEIPGQAGNAAVRQAGNAGRVMPDSDRPFLPTWTVRLKMIDVQGITPAKGGLFLNTGTRHLVQFVDRVDSIDMKKTAKPLRWDAAFQPEGTNVNFVEVRADGLHVRTFEKGVEGETLACGTGLTACALAAYKAGVPAAGQIPGPAGNDVTGQAGNGAPCQGQSGSAISYRLQCRRGDWLQVDFHPGTPSAPDTFADVYLTGPAELMAVNQLKQSDL